MVKHSISASALILASPEKVYALIADYRNGHPRILPKPYFTSLQVQEGGYGAGTVIDFQMRMMGRIQSLHSLVAEPEPGRILVETDERSGAVTTFGVEPAEDRLKSFVSITSTMNVPDGAFGKLQGWLASKYLRPIYVTELELLASLATDATL